MDHSLVPMITNYNEAIKMCEVNPLSAQASSNKTICGIQNVINQPVAERLKPKPFLIKDEDEDEKSPMSKTMCGCRLTAKVMFVMIILGITNPSGKDFIETYNHLFESEPLNVVNTIMGGGLNKTEIESIMMGQVPNVTISLIDSDSDLFIVQILKYNEWMHNPFPVHSFIIKKLANGKCQVLSSWFAGGDTLATPIISNTLSCEELNERLKPENLLNDDNTNFLFGQGNNLNGNLVTIFISKDAIISLKRGGRKNKTKKKRKIKKRKTK